MYCSFYGFREKPFAMTPNPCFLFLSKNHKEAFAHLLYGIRNNAGFIELTGEVGSGKTTVLRTLLGQLDRETYRTALIFNPCLSALELLQNINREYNIPCDDLNNAKLINSLNEFLLQENAAGRTVVLVIDEAQNLEPAVLEQIRLISNLETEKDKLLQILLVGQPELEQTLHKPDMRQLSQRITVHYHLKPLDYPDTVAYINHRMEVAGEKNKVAFSRSALRRIFRYSGGLPRLINSACDRSLLAGYMKNSFVITSRMAATAIADVSRETGPRFSLRRLVPVGLFLCAALVGAGIYVSTVNMGGTRKPEMSKPEMSAAEFSRAAGNELAKTSEAESLRGTFNILAHLWNVAPVSGTNKSFSLAQTALDRGLQLYRYNGNLGRLLRMDCPAVLELAIPAAAGRRYLVLTGTANDRFLIAPPILGRSALTAAELEMLWTGDTYLLWKNAENLSSIKTIGISGAQVKRLQGLLKEAGTYSGPLNAVFDKDTREAVREFQLRQGIQADGVAGSQTLLLLYRTVDRFAFPCLVKNVRKEAG
jgi:general secretion pathway protein A